MKKFLALALCLTMLFGMAASVASAEEVVTLKWVMVGNGMPANYDAWLAKINPYLAEKIGVNVEMEIIPWGDWDNRRNVIINTGEKFDIIFGNLGTFNNDVKLGAYQEMTEEMLNEHGKGLLELIPASYWDACRVEGKIYAVPTYKDSSMTYYFVWDKELLDEYKIDASDAHTLAAIEPILKNLKDKTDNPVFPQHSNGAGYLLSEYDGMGAGLPALGVHMEDKEMKVVSVLEQEDVMNSLKTLHAWFEEGYINQDAATHPEGDKYNVCNVAQGWPAAAKTVWGPNMGKEAQAVQFGSTWLSNETVQGSLNSISVNCEHPEKAIALLNIVNTDSYVRDLLFYGLEGDNWDYTEDGRVHKNNTDWSMAGYTQGTFFKVTQLDDVDFNQWDEVKELNAMAKPSVLLGFFFDTTAVQDEIASCVEIFNRYKAEVLTGTKNPEESVPEMMKEMRDAGFDKIVEEAQKQVDAFKAEKGM